MKHLPAHSPEQAADRLAQRITARLDEGTAQLPYDIVERLRAARTQALAHRKLPVAVQHTATAWVRLGASLALGGPGGSGRWWHSLAAAIPMVALVAGIMVIGAAQDEAGTIEIAEVDAALLASDLPTAAYTDPGFIQYLKTHAEDSH